MLAVNPYARIIETSFGKIDFIAGSAFKLPVSVIGNLETDTPGRPDTGSAVIKLNKPISPENLDWFIRKYRIITYRIKGFANTTRGSVAIQTSFGQVEIMPVAENIYHTEIVVIGPQIEQKILQPEFEYLCSQN